MSLLVIDSSSEHGVVALMHSSYKKIIELPAGTKHNEELLLAVENILQDAKININQVKNLAVITGPGSFTGIRVGIATIKAFAMVGNQNVLGATVFDVFKDHIKNGVMLIKCTNTSYYYAKFKNSLVVEANVINLNAMQSLLKGKVFITSNEQNEELLAYKNIETINNYAEIVVAYFEKQVLQGAAGNSLEPYYLALSRAEKQLAAKEELQ